MVQAFIQVIAEIPCDYDGVMGVPITIIDFYSPEQFEIIGMSASWDETEKMRMIKISDKHRHGPILNEKGMYRRIFIRRKVGVDCDRTMSVS